jgi:hypothetical protein
LAARPASVDSRASAGRTVGSEEHSLVTAPEGGSRGFPGATSLKLNASLMLLHLLNNTRDLENAEAILGECHITPSCSFNCSESFQIPWLRITLGRKISMANPFATAGAYGGGYGAPAVSVDGALAR